MEDIDLDSRQYGNNQTMKCKVVSVDLHILWEKCYVQNINQK